jgi:hypothetical protein
MGEKEKASVLKNPLTARAFIIGIVMSTIASLIGVWGFGLGTSTGLDRTPWVMIILVILSVFIAPWLKSMSFSAGELILIYVMTMTNAFAAHKAFGTIMYPLAALNSPTLGGVSAQWLPSLWFPKESTTWQPMLAGGATVPWGAWITPMLYWITLQICWVGIGLSFGFIIRRSLIEVERLPFPYTQIIAPLTSEVQKPLKERISMRLLLVGFIVGFIIQGTYNFFPRVIPNFPQLYPVGFWGIKGYDFGEILGADIYRNQLLLFFFDGAIWGFSIFFLLPTKLLLSALVVHFIWGNIIPYVEVSMGMVTNLGNWGLYSLVGWAITLIGTQLEPTGIQWYTVLTLGFPIGFVMTTLFFIRKSLSTSLKSAVAGEKSDTLAWVFFAISIIGYLALLGVAGVSALTSLTFLLLSFVYLVQTIRMRAECITYAPPIFATVLGVSWETAGGDAARNTATMYKDMLMCGCIQNQSWMLSGRDPAWVPFEGMRLLEMSGEKWDWKPLALATVVSLIISAFVSYVVNIWGTYTYGQLVNWSIPTWNEHIVNDIEGAFHNSLMVPGSYSQGTASVRIGETIGGIVLGVVVTAMNAMFAWWPLHPIGFMLGITLGWGLWNWALLAFIVRVLILKIGGSKLYNKAIQIVLGSLIGYALMSVLEFLAVVAGY